MCGILYIVSTPIGNPEDISLRALQVLRTVALIAAEDVHVSRKLLSHYAIETEIISYRPRRKSVSVERERTPEERAGQTAIASSAEREAESIGPIRAVLTAGQSVALVCDAGTPTLADPGVRLVNAALAWGAQVTPVPGPSAALAALVVSGLPAGRFAFDGFPPRARADRQAFFAALPGETRTLILYETRRYLRSTLQALVAVLGPERRIVIARNLTLPGETLFRGALAEALNALLPDPPRGEYVLILAGRTHPVP